MSALKDYQERTKQDIIRAISELKPSKTYVDNKAERLELSRLYARVKGLGDGFPSTRSFSTHTTNTLNKNVSESCPACVKSAAMLKMVDSAKLELENYVRLLTGAKFEQEAPKTIHELRPNIDIE